MNVRRPFGLMALGVGLLTLPVAPSLVPAQVAAPPAKEAPRLKDVVNVTIDRTAQRLVDAVVEYAADEDWEPALRGVQALLDRPEDGFIEVTRKTAGGGSETHLVSMRWEAHRLLAGLPPKVRQEYRAKNGPIAGKLLDAAGTKDEAKLGEIARRYYSTEAGRESLQRLARLSQDNGRPVEASVQYQHLLAHPDADTLPAAVIYQALQAHRRAGNQTEAAKVLPLLRGKAGKGGLKIGDRVWSLAELEKELDTLAPPPLLDWPTYRGGSDRSAQGQGGAPFLQPEWRQSTASSKPVVKDWTQDLLTKAAAPLQRRRQPILPSFFPVVSGDTLICRTYDGVIALDLKAGKSLWRQNTSAGLETLLDDAVKKAYLDQMKQGGVQNAPQFAFDNALAGTLSADRERVYVVDDLTLPLPSYLLKRGFFFVPMMIPALKDQQQASKLQALDLKTGKAVWTVGGLGARGDMADSVILGPPLSLDGKLYLLCEDDQSIRLVCLEAASGEVIWLQKLPAAKEPVQEEYVRRTQPCHLAYSDGVLVCPTGAGAIFGVDLFSRSLVWAHAYVPVPPSPVRPSPFGPNIGPDGRPLPVQLDWRASAPAIARGAIVFTSAESPTLHCIGLQDGRSRWQANRAADDLYFAGVFADRAVIVGKRGSRALNLADGKLAWHVETGLPTGQGIAAGGLYYLPLQGSNGAEVGSIDLAKGSLSRSRLRPAEGDKTEPLGNLLFHRGDLVSQSLVNAVLYPLGKTKLLQLEAALKKDPNDRTARADRAAVRLGEGDLRGAVEDLRAALQGDAPAEFRARTQPLLYEALTDWLRRDFAAAEKHAAEYEELCRQGDVAEQRRRMTTWLMLLMAGREHQGKRAEAVHVCLRFLEVAEAAEPIAVSTDADLQVQPLLWAQRQLAALLDKTPAEDRPALLAILRQKHEALRKANDLPMLRAFIMLTGTPAALGLSARLDLAQRLLEVGKGAALSEAELLLLDLRDNREARETSARAVEALSRLALRRGIPEDAAFYLEELGHLHGPTVIVDGKTGADLLKAATADPKLAPYFAKPVPPWQGTFKMTDEKGKFPQAGVTFGTDFFGETTPWMSRHRAVIDLPSWQMRLVDKASRQERWKSPERLLPPYAMNPSQANSTIRVPVRGRLAVFHFGHMIRGFDLATGEKIWEYNLFAPGTAQQPTTEASLRYGPDGEISVQLTDGRILRQTPIDTTPSGPACFLTGARLLALDRATGALLWARNDVSTTTHAFSDGQQLFLCEVATDGTATAGRAVRLHDGSRLDVPDFAKVYQARHAVHGRAILTRSPEGNGAIVRLHDALTGKDVWQKKCPDGCEFLISDEPSLGGFVLPGGAVTVLDMKARSVQFETAVNPADLANVTALRLVGDRELVYLAPFQKSELNVFPVSILTRRTIMVNGAVHALDRQTGQLRWRRVALFQHMIVDQFADRPVVVFAARYPRRELVNNAVQYRFYLGARIVLKHDGTILHDSEVPGDAFGAGYFQTLEMDPGKGTLELSGYQRKIMLALEK